MSEIVVAVDSMGGDNAPVEIVKGSILALENEKIKIILVGKEHIIKKELEKYTYDKNRIEVVNATQVIHANDSPTVSMKEKKDSSIIVGLKLVKDNKADAFVSAGSTGALLTAGTFIVGRLKGIERPAIAALIPNEKSFALVLDVGANVDCKPNYLLQFAKMGSVYMENILNIENPKIGLLNIGTEEEKGNSLSKESFKLISESDVNFVGNIEARELPKGIADVIVSDGFVGNIVLKYSEGLSMYIMKAVKKELMSTFISKIGAVLSVKAFKNLRKKFDASDTGGAPMLGLKSLVVKAHGNSDARAIKGAIFQCVSFVENDVIAKIEQKL